MTQERKSGNLERRMSKSGKLGKEEKGRKKIEPEKNKRSLRDNKIKKEDLKYLNLSLP